MSSENSYPEHEKLSALEGKNQTIGQFLDWLTNEQGYYLATYNDDYYNGQFLMSTGESIPSLLAQYFGIDEDKLEEEKREMLEEMRKANG